MSKKTLLISHYGGKGNLIFEITQFKIRFFIVIGCF